MERLLSENDPPPFWCHICKISCASALNLHTHFLGAKHKKVEESLRSYVYEEESKKEENEVENKELEQAAVPGETLMDLLNACRTTEPAVGLEHIYEYHTEGREGFCIYECRMCHCQTGVSNMFMHVVGAKHRIMYLSKYHPDMDIPSTFQVKTPARNKKLKDACEAVEKTFGRKQINVMKGSHAPRSFISGPEPFPAINYRPNNELQYIDFTADDFGVKKKDPEHKREATFRELKAAHEAKLQASGGPAQSCTDEQDDCDSDREVISMDLSECDPDEFLCNNELFDFLDSFKILNNGDVQFVLKVTERFSHALVNHKKSEEVRNTMMHDVGNKPPYQQSYDRSKERLNKNPGTNYQQNLQTDSSSNRGPVNEQRLHTQYPSEFGRNYNQNNEQPNPQYQRGHVTGPRPAGRLSTTTHDELGNFNQRKKVPDSQFNGGPIRESMPLLHTARPPSSHEGEPNYGVIAHSNFNKGTDCGPRPQFPSGRPSNLHEGGPNNNLNKQVPNAEFNRGPQREPRPIFPTAQPSHMYKDGVTNYNQNKMVPNSHINRGPTKESGSRFSIERNPDMQEDSNYKHNESFQAPQLNNRQPTGPRFPSVVPRAQGPNLMPPPIGSFPCRAPFPREVQKESVFRPKGLPTGLPTGKDENTARFFDSIKNMEVSEVVSTLNNIAATNPVFKGIHVPTVINYLKETGKLKTSRGPRNLQ